MAILSTDENTEVPTGAMAASASSNVRFLSAGFNTNSVSREISKMAVENYHRSAAAAKEPVNVLPYVPKFSTVALCGECANEPRFGQSHLCAECICEKARISRRVSIRNYQNQELLFRHWLVMVLIGGLLILAVIEFVAPKPHPAVNAHPVQPARQPKSGI